LPYKSKGSFIKGKKAQTMCFLGERWKKDRYLEGHRRGCRRLGREGDDAIGFRRIDIIVLKQ
jgi:hypothetical protein